MNQIKKAIEQCQVLLDKIGINNISKQHELIERIQAYEAFEFIASSNGGLTDEQIKTIIELIDGGFITAVDEFSLKMTN